MQPVILEGENCPYDSVILEILAIHKDFSLCLNSGGETLDEEFLTYPTAIVVKEEKEFIKYF